MHPINKYLQNFGFRLARPEGKPQLIRTYPIALSYPVRPKVRWSAPSKPNPFVAALLKKSEAEAQNFLQNISEYRDFFKNIPETESPASPRPRWKNDYLPPLDAMSLYTAIAKRKPATFLEIGSGNSTKFARRAITDHALPTQIISLDPLPRAEVDSLCDRVIRQPLEAEALEDIFSTLKSGDVLFFDGSHRCFQNSDVTVFFLESLWKVPPGVLIGIHDIFLPFDYPADWIENYYSEQYMLAAVLLGDAGKRLRVELPCYYTYQQGLVDRTLSNVWPLLPKDIQHDGGCFWFTLDSQL